MGCVAQADVQRVLSNYGVLVHTTDMKTVAAQFQSEHGDDSIDLMQLLAWLLPVRHACIPRRPTSAHPMTHHRALPSSVCAC